MQQPSLDWLDDGYVRHHLPINPAFPQNRKGCSLTESYMLPPESILLYFIIIAHKRQSSPFSVLLFASAFPLRYNGYKHRVVCTTQETHSIHTVYAYIYEELYLLVQAPYIA